MDKISLVDLYTLLGNAIDNAIESVDKLPEPDKKTISLTIRDQGKMLFFHICNIFIKYCIKAVLLKSLMKISVQTTKGMYWYICHVVLLKNLKFY